VAGYHSAEIGGVLEFSQSGSGAARSFDGLLQQAAVAALCHPLRTRHVTIEAAPRSQLLTSGIAMQNDAGYLGPISAVPLGVEQAQIGHEMRLVINGDVGTIRRFVIDIGIKFNLYTHGALSFPTDIGKHPKLG
jgi:hypothetical protein